MSGTTDLEGRDYCEHCEEWVMTSVDSDGAERCGQCSEPFRIKVKEYPDVDFLETVDLMMILIEYGKNPFPEDKGFIKKVTDEIKKRKPFPGA